MRSTSTAAPPQVIVPDNLKAAVTHSNRYESELNEDFASFANHYGCTVLPARVRRPKDKALVEGSVKICYRTIYPSIEDREFYDLEAMNAAIRSALKVHNNTPLTGRGYSRREQFEEVEKPRLGPINPIRFVLRKRIVCTVPHNEHIRVEKHYYSIPHNLNLIGKKMPSCTTPRRSASTTISSASPPISEGPESTGSRPTRITCQVAAELPDLGR